MIPSLAGTGAKRWGFGVWLPVILACMFNGLSAATFGLFTYTDNGTFITITDYPTNASGAVEIPATINGKPVTSIGNSAFYQCSALTSVSLGSSITSIGTQAFYQCSGLTSVTLSYGITSIGQTAFFGCTGLLGITIPLTVTGIGDSAFASCTKLITVYFKGNAPTLGTSVFTVNPSANVYFLSGATGWTSTYGGLGTVAVGLPTITVPPSSVVANPGENVVFSVIATTAPVALLSYQWQRNGVAIAGATSASLEMENVQAANAGSYTVLITNDRGTVASTATLSLASNNLYSQAQYDAALLSGYNLGYQAGTSQVTSNPNSYGLYNLSQVQSLHVGTPLLTKDPATGHFTLTIQAQKSTDLQNFSALPFTAGTATIDAEGTFKFDFISPDNAAFFRLETR